MSDVPKYLSHTQRGDRLNPSRLHARYCVLTRLRDIMRNLIASDTLPPGDTLLDFGCGDQPYKPLFTEKFSHYRGADLPGNDLAEVDIDPNGTLLLDDAQVDCVLSSQVLEHVDNPAHYLQEAFRVLRPGGSLILSTHGIWKYHPDPGDYWRWTRDGLELTIRRAGFTIIQTHSVLGLASSALILGQDATLPRLPRPLRPLYIGFIQAMISLVEWLRRGRPSHDGCVYVILARKPLPDSPSVSNDTDQTPQ